MEMPASFAISKNSEFSFLSKFSGLSNSLTRPLSITKILKRGKLHDIFQKKVHLLIRTSIKIYYKLMNICITLWNPKWCLICEQLSIQLSLQIPAESSLELNRQFQNPPMEKIREKNKFKHFICFIFCPFCHRETKKSSWNDFLLTAAVASSKTKILVFLSRARARQTNCLWPIDKLSPPSAISWFKPPNKASTTGFKCALF